MRAHVFLALLIAACSQATEGEAEDRVADEVLPEENPYGETSSLACPDFATGAVMLEAGGLVRELQVELPSDPEGAPVVFAWHWLGGTATETLDWMGMRELALGGAIVVAPETSGLPFEWDVENPGAANPDLALFDATLACLWEQHHTDADRVYATGMSAGGLMTTFLTMHRADVLAATAPFSGGAFDYAYVQPSWQLPVLLTWGGPADTFGGYDFHAASTQFADRLEQDGHVALRCIHALGHLPPLEAPDMAALFFDAHRRGEPSSRAEGAPAGLPDWCD